METGNKKHVVAERYIETGVADSLSNLYVCNYADFKVLSLYSDLSKRLLAYKILHQVEDLNEPWLDTQFNQIITVDFNPEYTLVPNQFSGINNSKSSPFGFHIEGDIPVHSEHYVHGIAQYNATRPESVKVYLFKIGDVLNILIFKEKNCVFSNSFNCQNNTEILYFVISALQTIECPQEQANVFLDYHLATNEALKSLFTPYFNSIKTLKVESEHLDEEILNLAELLFINYTMSLCA